MSARCVTLGCTRQATEPKVHQHPNALLTRQVSGALPSRSISFVGFSALDDDGGMAPLPTSTHRRRLEATNAQEQPCCGGLLSGSSSSADDVLHPAPARQVHPSRPGSGSQCALDQRGQGLRSGGLVLALSSAVPASPGFAGSRHVRPFSRTPDRGGMTAPPAGTSAPACSRCRVVSFDQPDVDACDWVSGQWLSFHCFVSSTWSSAGWVVPPQGRSPNMPRRS